MKSDIVCLLKKCGAVILAGAMLCSAAAFAESVGFIGESVGSLAVSAADTGALVSGDFKYTENSDGTVTITAYVGSGEKISVPSKLAGKSVSAIGNYAFSNRTKITSVTIGSGVRTIGGSAFSQSSKLATVTLPDTVTAIGDRAFFQCSGLTAVSIPASVTGIGQSAFCGCTALKTVSVPKKVTRLENSLFANCTALKSVTIGEGVSEIGEYIFSGCTSLTNIKVNSANKTYTSSDGLLLSKDKTKLILYPVGRAGEFTIPRGITAVAVYAFSGCEGLTDINFSESVEEIGDAAFTGCAGLKSINIPKSVRKIGRGAFNFCSALESAVIQADIEEIGVWTFGECPALKSVTLPDGLKRIGGYAFAECGALTGLTLPDGLTYIGEYAFSECRSLTEMNIPDSMTEMGGCVFSNCSALREINIPDGVTVKAESLFFGCNALEAVNVTESNKSYSSQDGVLFSKDKTKLLFFPGGKEGAYIIPDGVTSIGYQAFAECGRLTDVTIPDSVTEIGDYSFRSCYNLRRLSLPAGLTKVGSGAFSNCRSLTSVVIPLGLKKIGDYMFLGCTGLTKITIPKGIEQIGYGAFQSCFGLVSVKIVGNTLTKIGDNAFTGCVSLQSFTIPSSVTTIGSMAFYNCENIKTMTVPPTVTAIGSKALGCKPGVRREIDEEFVLCGQKDSAAEKYAAKTGIAFRITSYPDKLTMSEKIKEIGLGETYTLKAINGKGTAASVTWTSGSKSVATVSGGKVTAKKTGTTTITATSSTGKTATCKITVREKPSKITLSKSKKTLGVGEEYTLKVKFPDGSTSGALKWTSSSDAVKVENGKLTAWRTGEATITVRTYNGKTASCNILVMLAPSKVTLNKTRKTIGVGETYTLKVTLPKGSASGTMKWSGSSDYLDIKDGVITGKRAGTVSVWVYTFNGKAANCMITIKNAPSKVTLNKTTLTMNKGESCTLKATLPANTASGTMKWTSSNTNVVTVKDGKLTAKKAGAATITVKTFNGKTAKCKVTVK